MGVIAKGGGEFKNHPAGVFAAVCIDVIDLGLKQTQYGIKDHVRLVFMTDEQIEIDGQLAPAIISTQFTKTIGKDSNLRKFLEGWRGQAFTAKEIDDGFDVEVLLHKGALINIMHRPAASDPSKIYANIVSAMKLPKGAVAPDPNDSTYVRVSDRPKIEQEAYLAKFRGDDKATGATGGGNRTAPPGNPPKGYRNKPAQKMTEAPVEVDEDFPSALQDEDDDLPF